MKLTQAEIDALFAEYARNPDALEKIGQNAEAAAQESGNKAPAETPPASDAKAAAPDQADQAKQAAAPAPASGGKKKKGEGQPSSRAAQATTPATFPSLQPTSVLPKDSPTLGVLANVELDVSVSVGHTRKSIREILSLAPGSVLELDTQAGEAVDIEVNGRLVARGEVVVVGENYGVRITELISPDGGPTG